MRKREACVPGIDIWGDAGLISDYLVPVRCCSLPTEYNRKRRGLSFAEDCIRSTNRTALQAVHEDRPVCTSFPLSPVFFNRPGNDAWRFIVLPQSRK
jgi:hypothetical protein